MVRIGLNADEERGVMELLGMMGIVDCEEIYKV